jgi:hypothetical protein
MPLRDAFAQGLRDPPRQRLHLGRFGSRHADLRHQVGQRVGLGAPVRRGDRIAQRAAADQQRCESFRAPRRRWGRVGIVHAKSLDPYGFRG